MSTVLIVDADATMRRILKKSMERIRPHWSIIEAIDGESASEISGAMDPNRISLLITDLHLRAINGIQLIKHVRDKHGKIKAILTVWAGATDIPNDHGADNVLQKPFQPQALITVFGGLFAEPINQGAI
jgi:DNA-binding NtrC family response regulator